MPELHVDEEACTRCGLCAAVCGFRILSLPDGATPRFAENGSRLCNVCGHCEAVCPSAALTLEHPRLDPATYAASPPDIGPERLGEYLRMRRSIRRYRDEPVDKDLILRLMDVVRFAPTGRNSQDVRWLIVHDTRELQRLIGLAVEWMRSVAGTASPFALRFAVPAMLRAWEDGRDLLCQGAPHLVIGCARTDNPVAETNVAIALAHLEIAATSFGLGACWGGIFRHAMVGSEPLRVALEIPPDYAPFHCMMLGYPAIQYRRPPKRSPVRIDWR